MFAVTVTFELRPGERDRFLPLMHENAQASLKKEVGCLRFDVCTDPAHPLTVFLYEIYEDSAAFEVHKTAAHFLKFDAETAEMVAKKTVSTWSEVVS